MPKNIYEPIQDDSALNDLISAASLSDVLDNGAIELTAKRIVDDIKSDENVDWKEVPYYLTLVIEQNARLLGVVDELGNHISELPDTVAALRVLSDVANSIQKNLGSLVKNLPQKSASVQGREDLLKSFRGDEDDDY